MNPKYQPFLIIGLAIMLGFSIWQNMEQGSKITGLEAGQKLINDKFEDEKEINFQAIDSLMKESRKEETEKILQEISRIIPAINKTRYDKNIDRYRDSDSIRDLFARNY